MPMSTPPAANSIVGTIEVQTNQTKRFRKIGFALWLLLWPLVLAAWWFPIKFASLRLLIIVGVFALCSGALVLFWKAKTVRFAALVVFATIALLLLLPGREYSRAALRNQYVACLQNYDGAPYLWGGESARGIDCSGLVRRGMMDATLQTGIKTFNTQMIRASFDLWWHDASAQAMMEEYRGNTRVLFAAKSLNELDYAKLLPGDFAVTSSGVHTLAYIGNQTWIEADPGPMRVIQVRVPTKNAWFSMPMKIVRWREFE